LSNLNPAARGARVNGALNDAAIPRHMMVYVPAGAQHPYTA